MADEFVPGRYSLAMHGVGLCDEWPFIAYPEKNYTDYSQADFSGVFEENMTICVESYVGEVNGKEGVKLENQYVVTRNGLELLSKTPLNLI